MFENKFSSASAFSILPIVRNMLLLTIFFLSSFNSDAQNTQPNFESYEVGADNSVIFRFLAPNAKEVKLNTQLTKEPQLMTKGENGVWAVKLGSVKPDMYPYHFVKMACRLQIQEIRPFSPMKHFRIVLLK